MMRAVGAAVAALLLAGALSAAAEIPTLIAPYLQARDAGRIGVVTGEALGDPPRASAGPVPRSNVSVMLFPSAPELDAELSRIRAGLRDSERNYLAAAGRLRAAREGYERDLAFAGGGELSRGEVTDSAGRFRFAGVPAGQWLLLAWRDVTHPVAGRQLPKTALDGFVGNTRIKGFAAIEYWRLAVEVRPGESQEVRLNGRNVWLTVIQEDTTTPTSRAESVEGGGLGSKRRQGTTR